MSQSGKNTIERLPQPRPEISDAALSRPDWVVGAERDSRRLWLDKNENTDPELAQVVGEVMSTLPAAAYSTYPGAATLYAKLARSVGVQPKNLVLTAGADGAIRSVFEAFISPGDKVIHTVPTFAMYSVYSRMYGARAVPLHYQPSNAGPALSADTVRDAIRENKPKAVLLPNPDSPTGSVFPPDELESIVRTAGECGALVLVDEAYYPFYEHSAVPWIARFPHLVVARSTGKAWGLAGLRIGYAVASAPVATWLHKVRPMYEVNSVAVAAFCRLLDHEDAMLASVARLNAGKECFISAMNELGFRTLKSQGNFLHVSFGARAAAVHAALEDFVYYRKDFAEACLAGFSRFSATTPELFQPIIDRIRTVAGAGA